MSVPERVCYFVFEQITIGACMLRVLYVFMQELSFAVGGKMCSTDRAGNLCEAMFALHIHVLSSGNYICTLACGFKHECFSSRGQTFSMWYVLSMGGSDIPRLNSVRDNRNINQVGMPVIPRLLTSFSKCAESGQKNSSKCENSQIVIYFDMQSLSPASLS